MPLKESLTPPSQSFKSLLLHPLKLIKKIQEKRRPLEKQTKLSFLLVAAALTSVIFHNAFYGLFGFEEPVFFFLFFLLLLVFALSLGYNIFTYTTKGLPADLWRLGWLGLLGLLGFHPRLGPDFYGFYGFFVFFGLKKK